ncbi:MAG TPA: UDP-N-acetylmuramate--L-alanine ligase [Actinomycetes bacterium]|nr:UDP-N-acetylmuramate--L-alanine ligase [Actinomycetes bacterium]
MSLVELPAQVPPADELGRVHFIGIGGAGMSAIARIMRARGMTVSGSDARESAVLQALQAAGAITYVGHAAHQLAGVDTVVVSTAIRHDNPELAEARRLGLRVLPRAAALAAVMTGRRAVTVAGTHGKTSTTSLLTVALRHCGLDPSFAIGGELGELGTNAHDGTGDVFVAEADESDGSFLAYRPTGAVVTNIEADHLDTYGTPAAYQEAFDRFAALLPPDGFLVASADDPGAARLAARTGERGVRTLTYGEAAGADLRVEAVETVGMSARFEVVAHGQRLGAVALRVPGRHNVLNATAALGAGLALGLPFGALREGLARFTGTRRRLEPKGEAAGVRVIDSYAHHPSELVADLRAARTIAGGGRVVAAFQPHLYSRTQIFARELGEALGLADEVVVMDVYGAREEPVPGVSGALVAAAVPLAKDHVLFEPTWSAVPDRLVERAEEGDLVLTLGAGDVTRIGPEVLARLAARTA